jgi:rRNA small subunit pseudouridine methyltransferase Nep1
MSLSGLLERIDPSYTIALTSHGKILSLEEQCKFLSTKENPVVFIGAYPQGPMSMRTLTLANEVISIYPEPLEAWVVVSRLIYEFEKSLRRKT